MLNNLGIDFFRHKVQCDRGLALMSPLDPQEDDEEDQQLDELIVLSEQRLTTTEPIGQPVKPMPELTARVVRFNDIITVWSHPSAQQLANRLDNCSLIPESKTNKCESSDGPKRSVPLVAVSDQLEIKRRRLSLENKYVKNFTVDYKLETEILTQNPNKNRFNFNRFKAIESKPQMASQTVAKDSDKLRQRIVTQTSVTSTDSCPPPTKSVQRNAFLFNLFERTKSTTIGQKPIQMEPRFLLNNSSNSVANSDNGVKCGQHLETNDSIDKCFAINPNSSQMAAKPPVIVSNDPKPESKTIETNIKPFDPKMYLISWNKRFSNKTIVDISSDDLEEEPKVGNKCSQNDNRLDNSLLQKKISEEQKSFESTEEPIESMAALKDIPMQNPKSILKKTEMFGNSNQMQSNSGLNANKPFAQNPMNTLKSTSGRHMNSIPKKNPILDLFNGQKARQQTEEIPDLRQQYFHNPYKSMDCNKETHYSEYFAKTLANAENGIKSKTLFELMGKDWTSNRLKPKVLNKYHKTMNFGPNEE